MSRSNNDTDFLPSQGILAIAAAILLARPDLFLAAAPSFKSNSFELSSTSMWTASSSSTSSVGQDSVSAIDVDESKRSLHEQDFLFDLVRDLLRAFTTRQDVGSSLLEVISFTSESLKIWIERLSLSPDYWGWRCQLPRSSVRILSSNSSTRFFSIHFKRHTRTALFHAFWRKQRCTIRNSRSKLTTTYHQRALSFLFFFYWTTDYICYICICYSQRLC